MPAQAITNIFLISLGNVRVSAVFGFLKTEQKNKLSPYLVQTGRTIQLEATCGPAVNTTGT